MALKQWLVLAIDRDSLKSRWLVQIVGLNVDRIRGEASLQIFALIVHHFAMIAQRCIWAELVNVVVRVGVQRESGN